MRRPASLPNAATGGFYPFRGVPGADRKDRLWQKTKGACWAWTTATGARGLPSRTRTAFSRAASARSARAACARKIRAFAELLRPLTAAEVVFLDERVTTMAAHQILNLTDTRGAKRKSVVDTLSAEIILQNYLDRSNNV